MPSRGNIRADLADLFELPEQHCSIPRVRSIKRSFATLKYELTSIGISIKTVYKRDIVLSSLSPDCNIRDIKQLIAQQENIPTQFQILTQNANTLTDDKLLRQLIVASKSAPIYLKLKASPFLIQTEFGEDIAIDTLNLFDTVKDVKHIIEEKVGISCHLQTLRFNETELDDDDDLAVIAKQNNTLHLAVSPIKIKVKTARSDFVVPLDGIKPTTTVQDVKKMINHTRKFNEKARRLMFHGKELHNDRMLCYYKIKDGDKIYVNASYDSVFMFFVAKKKSKYCSFDLKPYDRIKDLKEEWRNKIGYKYFAAQQPFSIMLSNKKPIADEDLVYYYDLTTFDVKLHLITVFVSGFYGIAHMLYGVTPLVKRNIPVRCAQYEHVKAFKQQLCNGKRSAFKKLDPDVYILKFRDQVLCDADYLADYDINDEDVVELELKETTPALSVVAHDQGEGRSVCYAYAIATVLRAAEKRIIGRNPPEHKVLADQLILRYGENGADSERVLRNECPPRQLRWGKVSHDGAANALDRKHVLLGRFRLDDRQWDHFSAFFKQKNEMILTKKDIPNPDGTKTTGHAVAIYEYSVDDNYWQIKNSWGSHWGNSGFCKIGKNAIDSFRIYHVFYYESDLTEQDRRNYVKYLSKTARK